MKNGGVCSTDMRNVPQGLKLLNYLLQVTCKMGSK